MFGAGRKALDIRSVAPEDQNAYDCSGTEQDDVVLKEEKAKWENGGSRQRCQRDIPAEEKEQDPNAEGCQQGEGGECRDHAACGCNSLAAASLKKNGSCMSDDCAQADDNREKAGKLPGDEASQGSRNGSFCCIENERRRTQRRPERPPDVCRSDITAAVLPDVTVLAQAHDNIPERDTATYVRAGAGRKSNDRVRHRSILSPCPQPMQHPGRTRRHRFHRKSSG